MTEPITPTPDEAKEWPLRYRYAHEVKPGDYLISMGTFNKVHRVKTFEPYDSVQINAGGINYARRKRDSFWVLVSPDE